MYVYTIYATVNKLTIDSLRSLGADTIENTATNSYTIFACVRSLEMTLVLVLLRFYEAVA
jgi:hypothetical protein